MSLNAHHYLGGSVGTNAYLLETDEGSLLIDAPAGVAEWVKDQGKTVDVLFLTHQHFDHVEGVAGLVEAFGCKVLAWSEPSETLIRQEVARSMGLPVVVPEYQVDQFLGDAEEVELIGLKLLVRHLPGHSTDSVVAYCEDESFVASGDTLMAQSMGRTDLPGGDHELLLSGIREHLYGLPDDTAVLPGHGPVTTIGDEKRTNPFVR